MSLGTAGMLGLAAVGAQNSIRYLGLIPDLEAGAASPLPRSQLIA